MGGRGSSSMSNIPNGGVPNGSPNGNGGNWSGSPNIQQPTSMREALGTKGKSLSIADAVMGANPYYSGSYREFSENCQRCVVAYEARRRGYNVTAQPTFSGDVIPTVVHGNGRWQGAFKNAKRLDVSGKNIESVTSKINAKMKDFGNGSRAVVAVQWKKGGGHVINIENRSGKVYYVDAQVGQKYTSSNFFKNVNLSSVALVRTDNLNFSSRIEKMIEPAGIRTRGRK